MLFQVGIFAFQIRGMDGKRGFKQFQLHGTCLKASDGKLSAKTSKHVLGGAPTAESRILLISMSGLREFQAQDK